MASKRFRNPNAVVRLRDLMTSLGNPPPAPPPKAPELIPADAVPLLPEDYEALRLTPEEMEAAWAQLGPERTERIYRQSRVGYSAWDMGILLQNRPGQK
jgi:hypothetical protein